MKILVVEDEIKVRTFISKALENAGMIVDSVATLQELISILETNTYDIIVLDRLLKGYDSLNSIDKIKKLSQNKKIIILSALGDVDEKVKGLTMGADDYIGKPFHVAELVARIRALTRRVDEQTKSSKDTLIEYDDLKIDLEKQKVQRGNDKLDLTKKEFQVLVLLAKKPGAVFSKASILDQVWDINHYPESNIVEVTIANLRAKIDKGYKALIHSQRNAGYWFGEK